MKTIDGREIPMWEAKTTKPVQCPYCEDDKPLATRAYTLQTVRAAIEDKSKVPWVALCDEHRRPESVDYLYLVSKEPIAGYEPSLLCGAIHVMPAITDLHWCQECTHTCYRCGDDKQDKRNRIGIGDREINACLSCEAYKGPGTCTGCRQSAVHLGDPTYHYYHVPMPDWVWDRFIKGTVLEKKPTDNLFEADLHCDEKDSPTILFTLTEGGKRFSLYDIGNGLIRYLQMWRPVLRFDQAGNALDPWVYHKSSSALGASTLVGPAFTKPSEDGQWSKAAVMTWAVGSDADA